MLRFTIGPRRRASAARIAGIAVGGMAVSLLGALAQPPMPGAAATAANPSPGISVTPAPNPAITPPPPSEPSRPAAPTEAQLAQLVAPIALYPDPLLAQILMASTYPLEVVEAARWVSANQALRGDALTAALQAQNWDPSVKALVAIPRVLQMMSDQLDWTEALGNAFLTEQAELMAVVQSLRQQAMAAGNLQQTPQCRCVIHTSGRTISILPAEPGVVCVPAYAAAVYGPWPYPDYPPYYFPVPLGFAFAPGFWIGFGPPIQLAVFGPLWGWGWIDWGRRDIAVDPVRLSLAAGGHVWFSGGVWVHDPAHRGGVAYADPATRARFDAARVAALNAAVRGGGGRFGAGVGGTAHGAGFRPGAAALGGGPVGHGAAELGAAAATHGAAGFHGGMAAHSGAGSRGATAIHGGGVVNGGGAVHGGAAAFRAGPAPHGGAHFAMEGPGGGGPHGGGPHAGPNGGAHFATGGPRGGGPGGGPHPGSGGGPHAGGGAGPHGGGDGGFHAGGGGGPHPGGGGGPHPGGGGGPHGGGGGGPHAGGGGGPHAGGGGGPHG